MPRPTKLADWLDFHTWPVEYVLIGNTLVALDAFLLARRTGNVWHPHSVGRAPIIINIRSRRLRLMGIVLLSLVAQAALAQPRPNIVLIVADDIGFSDFGAFGGEIATPNIDALARSGVRFASFHAAASCAPTRAMLLTGVDSHLAGIGSMRELMPLSHRGKPGYAGVLNDRVQTVASLLRASGYQTMVAGKWHLGVDPANLPPARGFDHSAIQADSGSDNFEMRPYLPMKPEAYWYEEGVRLKALPDNFYSSRYFVDKTIEYLQAGQQDQPFFAYVAFQANHTPLQAPAHFIDQYRGDYLQGWAQVRAARIEKIHEEGLLAEDATLAPGPSQQEWDALSPQERYFEARRMQAYAGMATAMDYEIGRLVAYLRQSGRYRNTVFIVLSDNGAVANEPYSNKWGRRWLERNYHRQVEALGEKGSWVAAGSRWGRVANTPLDGIKFYASEGGVRVPLIIAGAGAARPGEIYHEFTYVTDIAATVLDIAAVAEPAAAPDLEPVSGKSLLPVFKGSRAPVYSADDVIGYEFSGNAALYRGDFNLVKNQPPVGDRQWRLYDIRRDPGETADLRARHPDVFARLQRDYDSYVERVGVLPMPDNYAVGKQVAINALVFFYGPKYLPHVLLALFAVLALWWYRRRRGRHA